MPGRRRSSAITCLEGETTGSPATSRRSAMQRREFFRRSGRPLRAACVLAVAGPATAPCWALFGFGSIVFDPANYAQTLTTALNAVKQTWAQYEQLRQQFQQLMQEARQLQSIDPAAAAGMLAKLPGTRELQALETATTA